MPDKLKLTHLYFYVAINTHFVEMFQVALIANKLPMMRSVVFFHSEYEGCDKDIRMCKKAGIEVIVLDRQTLEPILIKLLNVNPRHRYNLLKSNLRHRYNSRKSNLHHRYNFATSQRKRRIDFTKKASILLAPFYIFLPISKFLCERTSRLISQLLILVGQIYLNRRVQSVFKNQFHANPNSILILPEESFYYQTTIAVSVAKSSRVMTLIYPFSLFNDQEYYQGFRNNRDYIEPVLPKWLYRVFFPHFIYAGPEVELYIPLYYLGLCVMRGALPRLPWQPNTVDVDKVLVQSEKSKAYFLSSGVSLEKLRVVGHPSNSEIIKAVKNKVVFLTALLGQDSFDVDKKILLLALPPNQISRWSEVDCGFSSYENFLSFLLDEMEKLSKNYNIIIKPHPRINSSFVAKFKEMGIATTTTAIAPLVAISDVFIAFASATIQHTDLMKNKTINFDVYKYGYSDFDNYDNVINVYSDAEFKAELSRLMSDTNFLVEPFRNNERLNVMSFEERFYREIFD